MVQLAEGQAARVNVEQLQNWIGTQAQQIQQL